MMNKIIIALLVLASSNLFSSEEVTFGQVSLGGATGQYETLSGKVVKVYSANSESGARYRAYVVKWEGTEVVVQDMLGSSDKKKGDAITFVVQETEVGHGKDNVKALTFMFMEFNIPFL